MGLKRSWNMPQNDAPREPHSFPFLIFLLISALVCGSHVMVVEVLGSRVIGPFFGASLFIWTALIAVTLVGLALGYAAGGFLADRHESPVFLYAIIFLAGVTISLIPLLKKPVFELTIPMGLRIGALIASTLLFGLPLFLLGCVSPYVIRIAAREIRKLGRTVGIFYAVSTVGSFFGTVLTGFVLISYMKVTHIFEFVSFSLIGLSIAFFVFFRKRYVSLLLLAIPFLIPGPREIQAKVLSNGTKITKVFNRDTFYGNIKVLDYRYPFLGSSVRELLVDSAAQGAIDMSNGMPVWDYYYYLQYIPYSINPNGKSCLVIGLGTGIIPTWYGKMGIRTDVVDIDPEIFSVAEKYFGFRPSGGERVEDARLFLRKSKKKYDYIILDVFNGDKIPTYVLSLESFELLSRRLNKGGILGMNIVGSIKYDTFLMSSVIKTMQQVFMTVQMYPTFDPDSPYNQNRGIGNVEVFAYNFPPVNLDRQKLKSLPFHPLAASTRYIIGMKFSFPPGTPGMVLTDDYNPADTLELRVKEEIRRRVLADAEIEMLF
jgi:spermidine synthase